MKIYKYKNYNEYTESQKAAYNRKIRNVWAVEENIKFLSISHELIDRNLLEKLNNTEFCVWTVNDKERIIYLEKLGIKNFITDKITPQIYEQSTGKSRT